MSSPANPDDQLAPRRAEPGRWIGIETAGLYGTLAAAEVTTESCRIVAAEALARGGRSAQTLAPALGEMLERLGWDPQGLSAVAVAAGPGSFTGLRVGVVTAKAFAYASDAAIIGIDTLDTLAEATPIPTVDAGCLWTVLDAQRGELFAARFASHEGQWKRDQDTRRLPRQTLVDGASEADLIVGPIAEALADTCNAQAANAEPSADAVLRVAWREWNAGYADNVFALSPRYHRLSAAEEKLADPETLQ